MIRSLFNIFKKPTPLEIFTEQAAQNGEPGNPFLRKGLTGRVQQPSTDLTPFIIDRLNNNDHEAIQELMIQVPLDDPDVDMGPDKRKSEVTRILRKDFEKFIAFADEQAFVELQAAFIALSRQTGGGKVWITSDMPMLLATALACHVPRPQPEIKSLIIKVNKFIKKAARDTPSWEKFPSLHKRDMTCEPAEITEDFKHKILELPLSARVYLLSQGLGFKKPKYNVRLASIWKFGVHDAAVMKILTDNKLLVRTDDQRLLVETLKKKELLDICAEHTIEVAKSWDKEKILAAIVRQQPEIADDLLNNLKVMEVNPIYQANALALSDYAAGTISLFKALCFI